MKTNFLLAFGLLFSLKIFSQTTITLQPDGIIGIDAHVDNYNPNNTDANYPVINAGYNTVGGTPTQSHNFIQFNLSSIPTGSTIVSASLSLWHSTIANHSTSTNNEEIFSKVTQAWSESTVTWNTQPSFSSTDTVHIGTTTIGDDKLNINLASFVQSWVNTPAANYGMVMHLDNDPGTIGRYQSYASSDDANATTRPKLVITFIAPCANQTTTLQPDGSDGKDAHVDNYNPNNTDANYPVINAGYNTVGGTPTQSHNFIQFNLSSIPTGSTIVSASLSLWHSTIANHSTSTNNEEIFSKVTQAWSESTVTWNTQPSFSSTDTVHIGTTTIGDDKLNINLASFVQSWVNTPAVNYGMVMHLDDDPGSLRRYQSYASSDDANATTRPKLVVVWNTCAETGIQETTTNQLQVGIYPNPANNQLQILLQDGGTADVAVYNMLGSKIIEAKKVSLINVNELSAGFYLLNVSANGISKTLRFVKQ